MVPGADGTAASVVACDSGDTALSGSYVIINPRIANSISDGAFTQTQTEWTAQASETNTAENLSMQAIVNCFNNP